MRAVKKYVGFFISVLLFGAGCMEKPDSILRTYRFIDLLQPSNIISSPLSGTPDEEIPADTRFPVKSFPLKEPGMGGNPLNLKRKLTIGLECWNILLAPPKSEYAFTLDLEEGDVLEFGMAVVRDAHSIASTSAHEEGGSGIRFRIIVEDEGTDLTLFEKILADPVEKESRTISHAAKILTIPINRKKARLRFITEGQSRHFSFWINPELYRPQEKARNIILISLDTLRADHLGCYGYGRDTSPHIDSLSRDSALFAQTFASSPWTLPSHVSLLSALDCINHQVYDGDQKMDPGIITLAEFLRSFGFRCAAFTGGGFVSESFGFHKGFDRFSIRGTSLDPEAASTLSRAALNWIKRHHSRGFFLFLHTYQIHDPYSPPPGYAESFCENDAPYQRIDMRDLRLKHELRFSPQSDKLRRNIIGLYDAEIRYTDEALIKPLVDSLKELGIYDNTMLIVTSDHGEEFYEHQSWHHTHSVYNESIKVPLIIKFFDSADRGKRVEKFARLTDVMPTIMDVLDIRPKHHYMDGESLLPLLSDGGEKGEERMFLSELGSAVVNTRIPKKIALNSGRYKLIVNEDFTPDQRAYFNPGPVPQGKLEIYDLSQDMGERNNLAQSRPDVTRELLSFFTARYRQRRASAATKTDLDNKTREELRSLGYIK
jgi:arylsulfatase A-like enzyme